MNINETGREDTTLYNVVINQEEQYSILPEYKEVPPGWKYAEKTGTKAECLAHIKQVWTDMKPLSLRKRMEELAKNPPSPAPEQPDSPRETSLVDRLCQGDHPVQVVLRPERSAKLFKEAIDRNYIHIKFTGTKGGTGVAFPLDLPASVFSAADFESGTGVAHVEGKLSLDYVKVRCVANIDLSTLQGKGHLVKLEGKEGSVA